MAILLRNYTLVLLIITLTCNAHVFGAINAIPIVPPVIPGEAAALLSLSLTPGLLNKSQRGIKRRFNQVSDNQGDNDRFVRVSEAAVQQKASDCAWKGDIGRVDKNKCMVILRHKMSQRLSESAPLLCVVEQLAVALTTYLDRFSITPIAVLENILHQSDQRGITSWVMRRALISTYDSKAAFCELLPFMNALHLTSLHRGGFINMDELLKPTSIGTAFLLYFVTHFGNKAYMVTDAVEKATIEHACIRGLKLLMACGAAIYARDSDPLIVLKQAKLVAGVYDLQEVVRVFGVLISVLEL